jgi:signal transduction histidine kinase
MPNASLSARANEDRDGQALAVSRGIIVNRLTIATIIALICGFWTGPVFGAAWVCAVGAFEYGSSHRLRNYVATHWQSAAPGRARIVGILQLALGTTLYLAPAGAAWAIGGQSASFVAAIFVCITLVNAMTFYSNDRVLFLAAAGPAVLGGAAMAPIVMGSFLAALPLLLGIALLTMVSGFAIRDRNALIDKAVRYRTEAVDSERANAAKSQFLATMSHELRTPLNAVIGYAEIIRDDLVDGRAPRQDDAVRIAAAARSLLGLINDVLDLSKIEAGKLEIELAPARLSDIVRTAADLSAHIATANGDRVSITIDPDAEEIVTDAARLRQCMLNLVSNACKFTHDGAIAIRARREGARVRIDVADTGIGMSEDQTQRVFEPFQQADSSTTRRYGGTGLGLAITKKLCALLGAEIALQSASGEGTTVTIWLPAAPKAALAQAA